MQRTTELIRCTSPDPIDAVAARLPEIAQRHKFGVLGVHDLKQKLNSKGVDFTRECRVFEVCNPLQAKGVLEQSMDVSSALPCRISLYEQDGKTVLATIRPAMLLTMFDAPGAKEIAQQVEDTMTQIMEEAAAGT